MCLKHINDDHIIQILKSARLEYILQREGSLNAISDWNEILSNGEKQQIAMARVFYHKPQFVILDECTSALSAEIEEALYQHAK